MAADRGVRIYVVSLGSVGGPEAMPEGMPIYLQLDEPTLREVARMTGGEYHHAGTAEALRGVYENLGSRVQVQTRETEVTALLALLSAMLALTAGGAVAGLVSARRLSACLHLGGPHNTSRSFGAAARSDTTSVCTGMVKALVA
ncbi:MULTISPECIES: hypothetical protein [unclassified Polaromonas]|jgi:hypothetical protein|uniref:hypothetical protein n=1 Tax=unclassified Polaromonas TaxID=2638319 RepID=UPI000BD71580|nr:MULTISPECIES: hypothetical protein [unclassified Polaromonas]OYZ18822.1 MAG: hypothetical protein B7Y28_14340 [Polaromonas sp. 16-63-31]OYZ78945.1 MAG: hypothetical protein B7Y09_11785 [Polaromonas sp. 24-63-21]OZA49540.1 MAG: hypothetical protein B7X88_14045 [Polaromonas sp. 17-63-33]OYY34495.1 MAG: hypothetical protein B7Y60_15505 [Polaromonas sp. 35-63-35]OZA86917.1 MAG: hypothetical protein B7X65_15775 [Polaromonas sp. 39-63-25]